MYIPHCAQAESTLKLARKSITPDYSKRISCDLAGDLPA